MFKSILDIITKIKKILFSEENGIYYINGPETLPPPLEAEEETEISYS